MQRGSAKVAFVGSEKFELLPLRSSGTCQLEPTQNRGPAVATLGQQQALEVGLMLLLHLVESECCQWKRGIKPLQCSSAVSLIGV